MKTSLKAKMGMRHGNYWPFGRYASYPAPGYCWEEEDGEGKLGVVVTERKQGWSVECKTVQAA